MFTELKTLLAKRTLTTTVATLSTDQIRLNVIPHSLPGDKKAHEQIKYSIRDEVAAIPEEAIKALTTPISMTGTAEEIDAKLSGMLLEFTEAHNRPQDAFDHASTEICDAVKPIEERNKNKVKSESATVRRKTRRKKSKRRRTNRSRMILCRFGGPINSVHPNGTQPQQTSLRQPGTRALPGSVTQVMALT